MRQADAEHKQKAGFLLLSPTHWRNVAWSEPQIRIEEPEKFEMLEYGLRRIG